MNEDALQQIIWNIEHIGTPHNVSLRLLEKSASEIDIDEMTTLISQDATVSALILKTANSVHFSRGQRIKTIKNAIMHLGIENIKKLLFAVEMIGVFKGRCAAENFSEIDFWKHTLAGAILASKYTVFKKSCDPDVAYAAALLRDIGILAVRQFAPEEFEKMVLRQKTEASSFKSLTKTFLGVSYREISYMVGLSWNLPRPIIESIKDRATTSEMNSEISAIREGILFADELLHVTKYCIWDLYYLPGNFDFHDIPCEEMHAEASETVEKIIQEFWM
jgi:HD-like signal output (HDOD) protein